MKFEKTPAPNMVLTCKRFQITDQAEVAIADTVVKDYSVTYQQGMAFKKDRSTLRPERCKYSEKIQQSVVFEKLHGHYLQSWMDFM